MRAIPVLFEDEALLVVHKPAGVPVQTADPLQTSLLQIGEAHTGAPVWMTHRIDQPVSGLVVLAKTAAAAAHINEQFRTHRVLKTYLAWVSPAPPAAEGVLVHYFERHSPNNKSKAWSEAGKGRLPAELSYHLLLSGDRYHLLQLHPSTGRQHQIRAQLAAIGCPIKGDVKYGARRGNPDRSIHLHAWKLSLEHPLSGARMDWECPPPAEEVLWTQVFKIENK